MYLARKDGIKYMRFYGNRTTTTHKKYWKDRKIDWDTSYLKTWDHPHRIILCSFLGTFEWMSLMEIGVGGGANLMNILRYFPGRQLGGVDINPDAIKLCQETFKGGIFKCGTADDLMMSDKSLDVILTDMTMIYVGPRQIAKHLKEFRRVTRKEVVFCEFHEKKWWKRIWLHYKTGYFFYNWPKELKKYGFYDITMIKLPADAWPGGLQEKHCYLIKAKSPKRYV